jgi:hypothetical protein
MLEPTASRLTDGAVVETFFLGVVGMIDRVANKKMIVVI